MAELATLARPYARAVFDAADSSGSLQQWSDMLGSLSAIARQDKIKALCSSPELTAEQQAAAVIGVCGDSLNDKGSNLVRLLAENNRLPLLPEVANLFEQFKANKERTVAVEITSAFALDDATEQRLAAALQKKLDRAVTVSSDVDKALLGGVIIRAGDLVVDGSVRGKIAKLNETIAS